MLKPGYFFSVVFPVGAVWMECYHSHLCPDLIATDLLVDLLAEDLLEGFVDQEALMW